MASWMSIVPIGARIARTIAKMKNISCDSELPRPRPPPETASAAKKQRAQENVRDERDDAGEDRGDGRNQDVAVFYVRKLVRDDALKLVFIEPLERAAVTATAA
jgi:hypothetical protein